MICSEFSFIFCLLTDAYRFVHRVYVGIKATVVRFSAVKVDFCLIIKVLSFVTILVVNKFVTFFDLSQSVGKRMTKLFTYLPTYLPRYVNTWKGYLHIFRNKILISSLNIIPTLIKLSVHHVSESTYYLYTIYLLFESCLSGVFLKFKVEKCCKFIHDKTYQTHIVV